LLPLLPFPLAAGFVAAAVLLLLLLQTVTLCCLHNPAGDNSTEFRLPGHVASDAASSAVASAASLNHSRVFGGLCAPLDVHIVCVYSCT